MPFVTVCAGIELLSKMMGDAADVKASSVEGTQPECVPGRPRTWVVTTTFKRGLMRIRIQNEFTLTKDCRIAQLKITRS